MTHSTDDAPGLGQLFMVGLPGTEIDDSTIQLIRDLGIGHFILFRRNVESPGQLKKLCRQLVEACHAHGLGAPLISIDQEGGTVARLPVPFTQFIDARELAGAADPEGALDEFAEVCGRELAEMGINMNLAPVLDVCRAGEDFFMEKRSLGADPAVVARLGCRVIRGLQDQGIAACAKHFPGLGAAKIDPHLHLPKVASPLSEMRSVDLLPFQEAISCGVASIMTSHTIYEDLDRTTPATLSKRILTDLLRTEMGFRGVIVTDDLEMGAIENEGPVARAALDAFLAGADLLLICHDHDKVRGAYRTVRNGVRDKIVRQEYLEQAASRVSALQTKYAES